MELSMHLQSRLTVADVLKKGTVPTTFLRAAIIIGSGSASYEIIDTSGQELVLSFLFPDGPRPSVSLFQSEM